MRELKDITPACPLSAVEFADLVRASIPPQVVGYGQMRFSRAGGVATGTLLVREDGAAAVAGTAGATAGAAAQSRRLVCAIGAFDGVHRGHKALLARARAEADAREAALVVVTFSPDPSRVLAPSNKGCDLLSIEDRVRFLASSTPDALAVVDFTPELASLSFDRFVREVLESTGSELSAIVVGSNFRLGAQGAGDVMALADLGQADGFDVVGMELVDEGGQAISATRSRALLSEGCVERASSLLGRCYVVQGTCVHGRGEGGTFGFPTANVAVNQDSCLPAEGVYAGFLVYGGRAWPAAVNVGHSRTFEPGAEGEPFLEATLLGFEGDLYGQDVLVGFMRWLREPRRFSSVEELVSTVQGNLEWVRSALGDAGVEVGEAA